MAYIGTNDDVGDRRGRLDPEKTDGSTSVRVILNYKDVF